MVVFILICVALILVGAVEAKPVGYVVLGLALLALLIQFFGPPHWHP